MQINISPSFLARFKNYGVWLSLASLILMVLQMFGYNIAPAQYEAIVNTALSVLSALGILSNPMTPGYFDPRPYAPPVVQPVTPVSPETPTTYTNGYPPRL